MSVGLTEPKVRACECAGLLGAVEFQRSANESDIIVNRYSVV